MGKTTLARKLAESLGSTFVNDTESNNPYLKDFYRQKSAHALHTQLHFLMSRMELLESECVGADGNRHVVDFLLAKDRLFAELNLGRKRMVDLPLDRGAAQSGCHGTRSYDLPAGSVEILLQRIERRGLRFEQRLDSAYLQQVVDRYERFFHEYYESPLLIVNAQAINIADNPADFELLTRQIGEISAGRHYFNPAPLPA